MKQTFKTLFRKSALPTFLLGACLTLFSPVGAMAQRGGGHGGGGGFHGGGSFSGGHAFAGGGSRGYVGGGVRGGYVAPGRGFYGGGPGTAAATVGAVTWASASAPPTGYGYGYGPGYAYAPGCGYYDAWGRWIPGGCAAPAPYYSGPAY